MPEYREAQDRPEAAFTAERARVTNERIDGLDKRMTAIEHSMFGFPSGTEYVDGLLQIVADMKVQSAASAVRQEKTLTALKTWGIRLGAPALVITALSVFGNFLHNYGADQALGTFIGALLHSSLHLP
jgi:hypothetical protein